MSKGSIPERLAAIEQWQRGTEKALELLAKGKETNTTSHTSTWIIVISGLALLVAVTALLFGHKQ